MGNQYDSTQFFDLRNRQKKQINNIVSNIYFKEGDVRWASIGMNIRSEAYGKGNFFRRPILIIKKLASDMCIAIPLTSQHKEGTRFSPYHLHHQQGYAMLYQIRMIHKNRFQRKIGEMGKKDFISIKKRLKDLLNL